MAAQCYYARRIFAFVRWSWAPAGGARGEEASVPTLKCCKVFCALVVTVKRSVDQ